MKTGIVVVIIVVAALAGVSYAFLTRGSDGLEVTTVKRGDIATALTVSGTIVGENEISLTSQVPGRVTEVLAVQNQSVTKGETLLELDDRATKIKLDAATAKLAKVRVERSLTHKELQRKERLLRLGGVSRKELADARLRLTMANSDVTSAELEVEDARLQMDLMKISAPFDAVILKVYAKPGTQATTTDQLFRIAGKEDYQVELLADVADTGAIRPGQEVSISSDAYPERSWKAEILRIAGSVDESKQGNTVAVRARLPKNTPFRLGQGVDARIDLASKNDVPLLPFNAIRADGTNKSVAVVSNGLVTWRTVQTGIESLTKVEITQGITVGDVVVTNPQSDLQDGDQAFVAAAQ